MLLSHPGGARTGPAPLRPGQVNLGVCMPGPLLQGHSAAAPLQPPGRDGDSVSIGFEFVPSEPTPFSTPAFVCSFKFGQLQSCGLNA